MTENDRHQHGEGALRLVRWIASNEENHLRLDRAVAARVDGASRAQAKRWIEKGLVRVDGQVVRASRLLRTGNHVEIELPHPTPAEPEPEPIPLDILHEDGDLLVLVKPPHLVVHPAPGHSSGTLVNALLYHCADLSGIGGVARPGIVHRLDRGTSGLLVVAKNDAAHQALARQFAERTVEKRYLALVYGSPPERLVLKRPLGRDIHNRKRISSRAHRARHAVTEAQRIESLPLCSLLSVHMATGRTHQIRVHLSEAGFPLVGDRDYGRARRAPRRWEKAFHILQRLDRPALHAAILGFRHPRSGAALRFEAPLAADIQQVLAELRTIAASDA